MAGYKYMYGGRKIADYAYSGDATQDAGNAVGISDGSLAEAFVRAAEHARDVLGKSPGDVIEAKIEIVIGPNPPISQYKVIMR